MADGVLTPAYGRDYKNTNDVLTDFRAGKDFVYNYLTRSVYCSIRDFEVGERMTFRYNGNRCVMTYTIAEEDKQ